MEDWGQLLIIIVFSLVGIISAGKKKKARAAQQQPAETAVDEAEPSDEDGWEAETEEASELNSGETEWFPCDNPMETLFKEIAETLEAEKAKAGAEVEAEPAAALTPEMMMPTTQEAFEEGEHALPGEISDAPAEDSSPCPADDFRAAFSEPESLKKAVIFQEILTQKF